MKKIYSEPEIEVVLFSKQDHIRASSMVNPDPVSKGNEDPISVANGIADGFFWY